MLSMVKLGGVHGHVRRMHWSWNSWLNEFWPGHRVHVSTRTATVSLRPRPQYLRRELGTYFLDGTRWWLLLTVSL